MEIQKADLNQSFLRRLGFIPDPPERIWLRGVLPELGVDQKVVSIVGSRKNTRYGEEVAYRLAYDLARSGVIVVSGLAYGIDACAHRGCLDGGGVTVAVLGTAIDRLYPAQNLGLARRILEGGAVVSEYGVGEVTGDWSFPERNRLVSGLADAVVIVEAAARSGTLITAAHALEQGRDVFAVPGDVTRPLSVGCNRLIRQGALPFTEVEDVLGVLFPRKARRLKYEVFGDTDGERAVLGCLKRGIRDGDKIIETTGICVSEFNQVVTVLEIRGVVRGLGGNYWVLV